MKHRTFTTKPRMSSSKHLDALRAREDHLTESEQQELQALILEIEKEEWNYLQPGFVHRRTEQAKLETQIEDLTAEKEQLTEILAEQRALVKRARALLAGLQDEHNALRIRYKQLTGEELVAA